MTGKLTRNDNPIAGSAASRQRRGLPLDRYMGLAELGGYSALSVRKLRDLIKDPVDPLPSYRVGGKILVKQSEFDEWINRFRVRSEVDVDALVSELTSPQ